MALAFEQPVSRRFTGSTLVLATHNPGKLAEMSMLLSGLGAECRPAADFALPIPDETGATFFENAAIKARHAAAITGLPALADDSGFCVEALGGLPGIHSLDWAGPTGDFTAACQRVLDMLESRAVPERGAYYTTALALCWPDGHVEYAQGRVEGIVAPAIEGNGFGYDSIFIPAGETRTMAIIEASPADGMSARSIHSHRAQALHALIARCFPESNLHC